MFAKSLLKLPQALSIIIILAVLFFFAGCKDKADMPESGPGAPVDVDARFTLLSADV